MLMAPEVVVCSVTVPLVALIETLPDPAFRLSWLAPFVDPILTVCTAAAVAMLTVPLPAFVTDPILTVLLV
jgi:hypothetical protein